MILTDALASPPVNRLLKMAVLTGVESSVRLHIDRGDNLNARDDKGLTLLMIAASRNKANICKLLLDANADPSLVDSSGRDALALAKAAGASDAAKIIERALAPPPPAPAVVSQTYTSAELPSNALAVNEPTSLLLDAISATNGAWDELDAPFDLSGWVEEIESAPPIGDASLALPAIAIHVAISEHAPIDSSADWDEFEAFLPSFAAPLLRVENLEKRDRLRSLLLRAMREGSVPAQAVEDLCVDDAQRRNLETEFSLIQTINDLGADCDERFEYDASFESFQVFVAPEESEEEEEALAAALGYFDALISNGGAPLPLYFKDSRNESLLTASEEATLGQAMEGGLDKALDALAAWPAGLSFVMEDARLVISGSKPLAWMVATKEEAPPNDAELAASPDALASLSVAAPHDAADEEDEQNDDLTAFAATVKALSGLARADTVKGPNWSACRDVLASLGLQKPYVMAFMDGRRGDAHPSAALFAKTMEQHRQARERMAVSNLRLVLSIARRYLNSGMLLDDLIQEGNVGLLKAVDRFDWRKGFKFSTYATWWIRQQISRTVSNVSRSIRLPSHVHQLGMHVIQAAVAWEKINGRFPTPMELGAEMDIAAWKVEAILREREEFVSLDAVDIDDLVATHVRAQFIAPDPSEAVESHELTAALGTLLAGFGRKREQVIRLRFGFGVDDECTLEELGARLGLTRERIRQIEAKTIRLMKHPAKAAALVDWANMEKKPAQRNDVDAAESSESEVEDPIEDHLIIEPEIDVDKATADHFAALPPEPVPALPSFYPVLNRRPSVLERLLQEARELGILVEDERERASGCVWVRIHKAHDTNTRVLIRKLINNGFAYAPGAGYGR